MNFGEFSAACESKLQIALERRPANALNVEIGQPMDRCLSQSPDGRGLAWLRSGGEALAYGVCCKSRCPMLLHKEAQHG